MVKVRDYLQASSIARLNAATREEVVESLLDVIDQNQLVPNLEEFSQAISDREKIVTTGIGMGVAIPHAKLPSLDHFFIVIGITQQGVDWNALDGAPVRLVFMIGGPDDKQTEYLQILSGITQAIKNEDRRKQLLSAKDPKEVMALLEDF